MTKQTKLKTQKTQTKRSDLLPWIVKYAANLLKKSDVSHLTKREVEEYIVTV